MYQRIVELLLLHGYAKTNTDMGPCYVKELQQGRKGIFVIYDTNPDGSQVSEEEYRQMILDAKTQLGEDVPILLLILSKKHRPIFMDPEEAFTEMLQPVNMILSAEKHRQEQKKPRTSRNKSNLCIATIAITLINIIMFLVTEIVGQKIYDVGACNHYLVLENHEWYRLFTSNYLHYGFEHLFNNMLVFCLMGSVLEKIIGSLRYVILYTGAGIIGSLVSVFYYSSVGENAFSAGASGAIFGITGALAALFILSRKSLGNINGGGILIMLVGTLYHGFQSNNGGVDNAAHIGGCIAGFFIMAVITLLWPGKSK